MISMYMSPCQNGHDLAKMAISRPNWMQVVRKGCLMCRLSWRTLLKTFGAKLVRQTASKTNDPAGDGTTTSVVLAQGLIAEGVKVVAAGAITQGIEKTTRALVQELKLMSKEVEDIELADLAAVSAGNNYEIGNMIVEAMSKV